MSDIVQQQLLNASHTVTGNMLWIIDEQDVSQLMPMLNTEQLARSFFLTHRYDQAKYLKQYSEQVYFSDLEFDAIEEKFSAVFYRISKEKAVVHYCINQVANILLPDGQLFLAGYKNEGCKTYIEKAGKYLGQVNQKTLGGKTAMLGEIVFYEADKPLDDKNYQQMVKINDDFFSKPGVFGWQKIDKGSEFLIQTIKPMLQEITSEALHIIDLGCGYGYLTVKAAELVKATFAATDNNMAAIHCCEKNITEHNINATVISGDAGYNLPDSSADIVLCNPPFHQGFSQEYALTEKFLQSTKCLLKPKGIAYWVVNAFIPVERLAAPYFTQINLLDNNKQFKVFELIK